jgi:hypothetical protein
MLLDEAIGMKTKRLPSMSLVVALSAGVAACDSGPVQRDVYSGPQALQNCIADWGNVELCKQHLSDDEKKKVVSSHPPSSGHSVFLWGPSYGADRKATRNGVTYTPTATHATRTATLDGNMRPVSFSSARGGFGATGHGVGSVGS